MGRPAAGCRPTEERPALGPADQVPGEHQTEFQLKVSLVGFRRGDYCCLLTGPEPPRGQCALDPAPLFLLCAPVGLINQPPPPPPNLMGTIPDYKWEAQHIFLPCHLQED